MNKPFRFFRDEYKEIVREKNNSPSNSFTSVGYLVRIFLDPRRLIKLFDPLVWRIVLSYTFNPPGLTERQKTRRFFNVMIKSGIFFVVTVLIYRSNRYLLREPSVARIREFFPLRITSSQLQNDPLEEAGGSSTVDRFVLSLLSSPKRSIPWAEQEEQKQEEREEAEREQREREEAEREQREREEAEREQREREEAEREQREREEAEREQREREEAEQKQREREEAEQKKREREEEKQNRERAKKENKNKERIKKEILKYKERGKKENKNKEREKKKNKERVKKENIKKKREEAEREQREREEEQREREEAEREQREREEAEREQREREEAEREQREREEAEREQREREGVYLSEVIQQFTLNRRRFVSFFSDLWVELKMRKRLTRDHKLLKKEHDLSVLRRGENTEILKLFKIIPYLHNTVSIHPIPDDGFEERFLWMLRVLHERLTDPTYPQSDGPVGTCEKYGLEVDLDEIYVGSHQIVVFANKKIREAGNHYRLIRNLIQFFGNLEFIISKFITTKFITIKIHNPYILKIRQIEKEWENYKFSDEYKFSWLDKYINLLDRCTNWLSDETFKFSLSNPNILDILDFQNLKKLFLDDDGPCQEISESMVYSVYEVLEKNPEKIYEDLKDQPEDLVKEKKRDLLKSVRASLPQTHSDLSMIFDDPYDWLNPVKPFRRSSLISAFYKANRLQFMNMNKQDYFSFYCNKKFPFYVEKSPINYYHFIYRQFLNTFFIKQAKKKAKGNKKFSLGVGQKTHAFGERDLLSAIQAEVSKILKSMDLGGFDPFMRTARYSILDNRLRRRASKAAIVDIYAHEIPPAPLRRADEMEISSDPDLQFELLSDDGKSVPKLFSDDLPWDPFSGIENAVESPGLESEVEIPGLTAQQVDSLEATCCSGCQPLPNINLANLASEVPNFDKVLSHINLANLESEVPNFDESRSDINLDDDDLELEVPNFFKFLSDFFKFLSDLNLANLESEVPNFDESRSDINLDDDDLEQTNFDKSLSDLDKAVEQIHFDESYSDIDLALSKIDLALSKIDLIEKSKISRADLKAITIDLANLKVQLAEFKSLLDINLDDHDLQETNFDFSLSDLDEDLERIKFYDVSLSELDKDLKRIKFSDVSISDMNRPDSESTNFDEFLSDINLDNSEVPNFDKSLLAVHPLLQKMPVLRSFNLEISDVSDITCNSESRSALVEKFYKKFLALHAPLQKALIDDASAMKKSLSSLVEKFYALKRVLKIKKNRRRRMRRMRDIWIKKRNLTLLYRRARLVYERKQIKKKKKKRSFSTRRSKRNLFRKYISPKKWKRFKKYLRFAFSSSGFRYQTSLFLEIVSDLSRRIWDRERRRGRVPETKAWRKKWLTTWKNWTNWKTWRNKWMQSKQKWNSYHPRRWRYWINERRDQWTRQWTSQWTHWRSQRMQWTRQWTHWRRKWTRHWMSQWIKSKQKWAPKFKHWATEFKNWDSQVFNLMILINGIISLVKVLYPLVIILIKMVWLSLQTDSAAYFFLHKLFSFVLLSFVSISLLQLLFSFVVLFITFPKAKSLIMDEVMIETEVEELLAEYPPTQLLDLGLRFANFCIGLLEKRLFPNHNLVPRKKKFFNINLSPIINLIKILSNELVFVIKTRSISSTSKEIYSFLRKRKKVAPYWNQTADWVSNHSWIEDEEREVLMQFITLRRTPSISEILWSLTFSDDCLGKDDVLPEMIEQPGEVYLRKVIDFHKKDLLNYEFDPSCLAEKRIFLALYHTMIYSQPSSGVDSGLSRKKPFSLRLSLAPSKHILVIGSIGLGRSYLVNYLAKNSYLPFIPIFLDKFVGTIYDWTKFDNEEWVYEENYWVGLTDDFPVLNMLFPETRDDIELLSEDMQSFGETNAGSLLGSVANFFKAAFDKHDWEGRALDNVTLDDQSDDMDMVVFVATFYSSLQIELAKAMSPCLIWIPNVHELNFEDSFFSIGVLGHLLSWDCERSSSSNNLVIASTHRPQEMQPSLIDTRRFNMCIKVRRPSISQQRKTFSILAYTSGFRLEREIFEITHGFESLTLGSNMQDVAALTNEALLISLSQGKSIIDSNTIRHALHRQTWDLRAELRPINNSRILSYQIGRVVVHYTLLKDSPIDPLSIYMSKRFYQEREPYLYRWYYQLSISIKKLTILIYLLTCSSGLVAQELWSPSELDANTGIASGSLLDSNSDLVHGLLEIEGVLEGLLPTKKDCSQFDKDRTPVLRRPEPRNSSDMVHTGFWAMLDEKLIYQKDPSAPPVVMGGVQVDLPNLFENFIVWAPKTWFPWGFLFDWIEKSNANEVGFPDSSKAGLLKEIAKILAWGDFDENDPQNDSHSDEDEDEDEGEENPSPVEHKEKPKKKSTFYALPEEEEGESIVVNPYDYDYEEEDEVGEAFVQGIYRTRARMKSCQQQLFFGITQFIWDPGDPLLLISEDLYMAPLYHIGGEFFPDQDQEKWFIQNDLKSLKQSWFINETQENHGLWLIERRKWIRRRKNSLSRGSFRSTALSESYQYLSNLLLSQRTVVNQMQKLLMKKRWLFPDDMQKFFNEQHHPAETRKN